MSDTPITDADEEELRSLWGKLRQHDRIADLERQLAAVTEQRDAMADALRIIMGDGGEASPVNLYEAQGIACEALAAVKGGSHE